MQASVPELAMTCQANRAHTSDMEMPLWFLVTVLVVLSVSALRYGVDSRNLRAGEGPSRRGPTPWSDLVALVRRLGQVVRRPVEG